MVNLDLLAIENKLMTSFAKRERKKEAMKIIKSTYVIGENTMRERLFRTFHLKEEKQKKKKWLLMVT